jgi:hypothetical protein
VGEVACVAVPVSACTLSRAWKEHGSGGHVKTNAKKASVVAILVVLGRPMTVSAIIGLP